MEIGILILVTISLFLQIRIFANLDELRGRLSVLHDLTSGVGQGLEEVLTRIEDRIVRDGLESEERRNQIEDRLIEVSVGVSNLQYQSKDSG